MTRRTPGPPHTGGGGQTVGFSPAELGLLGYHGAPSGADVGGDPVVPMNPSTLPPGLSSNDWMSMSMSELHGPNAPVPARPILPKMDSTFQVRLQSSFLFHNPVSVC